METRKQQFKSAVSDAIVHLQGSEEALAPFGWTGEKAGWIAFVCLHSGAFTRVQCARFLDAHPEQVRRVVHALIAQGLAAEDTVPGIRGTGRVCRIFSRRIYRAIGAEHIRHRRDASPAVLMRRLLSLDYVIEHPGLPWLATESEKVAAFEALGIEHGLLPVRVYRGAAGATWRYFPVKLPVALDAESAVFVYADPGHATATALHSWGAAHRGLWHALGRRGRSVEVVAVGRPSRELERARRVMRHWAEPSGPAELDPQVRKELARIEEAILAGAVPILEEYGGLQAAMKRSVALEKQARRQAARASIRRGTTWRTARLATDERRATYGRTGVRKRRGGTIHTSAPRRFTRSFPPIRWRGSVLRFRGQAGQRCTGGTVRGGSDPPAGGPGTGGRSLPNIPGGKATEHR